MVDVYFKVFVQKLRRLELEEMCIQVLPNISSQLKKLVRLLVNTQYRDGFIHAYYGDIKEKVIAFNNFWRESIDMATKEVDLISSTASKDDYIALIDISMFMLNASQTDFAKEFLPVTSPDDKEMYIELEGKYKEHCEKILAEKERANAVHARYYPLPVIEENLKITLQKMSDIFEFTHTYIAMFLVDRLYQLRSSLEDIHGRVRRDLNNLVSNRTEAINTLKEEMLDANQRRVELEKNPDNSLELAEVLKLIKILQRKMEDEYNSIDPAIEHLEMEVKYWGDVIEDFDQIYNVIKILRSEQVSIIEQEKEYNNTECFELPGSKTKCWTNIGDNIQAHKQELNLKISEAALALFTHFAVAGSSYPTLATVAQEANINMIEPTKIYNDPYKHRISILEYGLHKRQVKCDGSYCETEDNETAYHYDKFGRYTIDQNEKIYERATCASSYKLDENKLFQKVTKDCGHSEAPNKECEIEFKDPTDEPIFPIPPHCSGQMDQNAMTYIFEHFGAILPTALADVEKLRPRNPIHYLGHRLLRLKYTKLPRNGRWVRTSFRNTLVI
ncbi:uncharacterized protein LOC105384844 [Plutella xylostella]|uniref:uncharacterized protein LOC105384844 n=1 Tax=Plutella xylostella TaxID=51655 RepID=UPI002032EBD7|nr:uncharacterized protein LOC105384844 [Plutella xylostella]